MSYATPEQLAEYLGVDEGDLPPGSQRQLNRASELIDTVTLARYNPATADPLVIERVVRATCAQVEYWQSGEHGESVAIDGAISSYRAGSVSVAYAGATGAGSAPGSGLTSRARDALFLAGLLNSAVAIAGGGDGLDEPESGEWYS